MRKVRITNLANYARQIQYYGTNKFVIAGSQATIEINCEDGDAEELSYYLSLNKKKFKVTVIEARPVINKANEVKKAEPVKETVIEPITPKKAETIEIIEEVNEVPETIEDVEGIDEIPDIDILEENETEEEPEEAEETKAEVTYDDLTDFELKKVLANMGVQTSLRARYKLIDLIEMNLPEDKTLADYL